MAKILYPVGTKVVITKPDKFGYEHLIGRVCEVSGYIKGHPYPYKLRGVYSTWNVKELKRYNPTQADERNTLEQPEPSACNCYTAEEVDALLAKQWEATVNMLSPVNSVATDALRNTYAIAEMADHNFTKVAKKFKTLNHDDD